MLAVGILSMMLGKDPIAMTPIVGEDVFCETTGITVSLDHDKHRMWIADPGAEEGQEIDVVSYSLTGRRSAYVEGEGIIFDKPVATLFVLQESRGDSGKESQLVGTLKVFGPTDEEDIVANFRCREVQ